MTGVIPGSSGWIDQRFVRFQDLTEPRRCRLITRIDIRVIPTREATISPLDLGLGRSLLHAQDDVQIH
jgi:hypothetical protein